MRSLAFSPDGKRLVAAVGAKDQPGAALCWDAATGRPLWRRDGPAGFPSASFAPDGGSVAVADGTPTVVRLDPATGEVVGRVGPHPENVRVAAYLPGSGLLATGSDGVIRLWDAAAGEVRRELKGHPKDVGALVVSPDGRWLVSTGSDGAWAWDLTTGEELKGVIQRRQGIGHYGVAFPGPDLVMYAMNDGVHRVREVPAGRVLFRFHAPGGYDRAAYSPVGGVAAFWSREGTEVTVADLTFRPPTAAEGERIAGLLRDFDADSYDVREAASEAMRAVGSVAEPALRKAEADGPSAEVRMRARETRKAILEGPGRRLAGHTGAVGPAAFSPDGTRLATGAADGTVRVWDPKTGRELLLIEVSPDGGK